MIQYNTLHVKLSNSQLNPNKAGLFEGSFSWDGGRGGVSLTLPPTSYFKKNVCNFNINLHNC